MLIAPDMVRVDLAGQPAAPRRRGARVLEPARGMVFAATSLPPLPGRQGLSGVGAGHRRQPISAGLLAPDAQGRATPTSSRRRICPTPVALAVTLEPEGGVPQPTGEKVLVGAAGL